MPTLARPTDRESLLARFDALSPEAARQWGTMNAHQMICHVNDAIRVALGDLPAQDCSTWASRTIIRFLVLRTPIFAPKGKIQTAPEMLTSKPETWDTDVRELKENIARLADATAGSRHPMFGELTAKDWQALTAKHLDFHLRQFGA